MTTAHPTRLRWRLLAIPVFLFGLVVIIVIVVALLTPTIPPDVFPEDAHRNWVATEFATLTASTPASMVH